jgi:hypothetical protein
VSTAQTPISRVTGPLDGGKGWPFGSPPACLATERGYLIEEFLLHGTAQAYAPAVGSTVGLDGRWSVEPSATAAYRTRMYVVRPADPARFNGVVLVNWQNVTAGFDIGAPSASDLAQGYAWVGVTAQRVGIEGQPSPAPGMPDTIGLAAWDPERYGSLHHPGDEFSYDIFTQAARKLAADPLPDDVDLLGGLQPRLLVATGESQSAMRLGSYINMVDDAEPLFDAFLLNLHWGVCPYPPNQSLFESFAPIGNGLSAGSAAIYDRGRMPILVLNTESETLRSLPVRQPDTATFRFWEMAGTAHMGGNVVPETKELMVRDGITAFMPRDVVNTIDWGYVRNAALDHLVAWAGGGTPPPSFPPINVEDGSIVTDEIGNATGGIRLPDLAVPTAVHSGTNALGLPVSLVGQSSPLTHEQLCALYPDADAYLKAWNEAVDAIRAQGLILDSDLDAERAGGRTIPTARWTS